MKQTIILFSLVLSGLVFTLSTVFGQTSVQSYEAFPVKKKFVHLPVKTGAPKTWMTVNINGVLQHEFEIELAPGDPDFYATLEVGKWPGKRLTLTAEKVTTDSKWLSNMKVSDEMSDEALVYKEAYRPQFHFSPRRGWTNDPNGLVCYKGTYHLFFQHNPYGTAWGNMTWGHAVSTDLLHWTEKPDAVLPDKNGVVFSGSGLVDWDNTSGMQKNPKLDESGKITNPPLILFYTSISADRGKGPAAQSMVYSLDEGKHWKKYPENPVLPNLIVDNRDPKVFWYGDRKNPAGSGGHWVMALYLEGENYALFSSQNLTRWEKICDIKNLGCSECPDMFELPVDGKPGLTKWVFWGGDGKYVIGSFDGKTFSPEAGPFTTKYGGNDYAAQTYSDIPAADGRRIQFSWMAGSKFPGMPFNQQFTVPRSLTLRTTPAGIRLFMEPVSEIESLRAGKALNFTGSLKGTGNPLKVNGLVGDLLDIGMEFSLNTGGPADTTDVLNIEVFGQKISYNAGSDTISLAGIKAPLALKNNELKIRLIIDRTSIELFADGGEVQIANCFINQDNMPASMSISGKNGLGNVRLKAYPLKSVWTTALPK
jgi:sucrose-6-phosphate hydrolase SacC (GH32 family)